MGDGLKLSKDKRHRSSSSLSGVVLEGTRSERKLEMNASIPEVDDQFIAAEARCDDLQEKIDLIKSLKRKKKLRKRSMTKVMEQPQELENIPFISVRTQPKKKVSQQAARLHRLEVPPNPTRGYLDPATLEQHRMIGQVRGYHNAFQQPPQEQKKVKAKLNHTASADITRSNAKIRAMRRQRAQAYGDNGIYVEEEHIADDRPVEVACGQDQMNFYNDRNYEDYFNPAVEIIPQRRQQSKLYSGRRKQNFKEIPTKETNTVEERPVVELFNKDYVTSQFQRQNTEVPKSPRKTRKAQSNEVDDQVNQIEYLAPNVEQEHSRKDTLKPRRGKNRSRRYEMPTVASQMKQAGMRYYYNSANYTNIPFVVSKSTAPSHNIGVNIQQVLNGLKIQQPLSGIPLTIAHHMGLGHVPTQGTKSAAMVPALDHREINAIKVGHRLLRLPSYKYVSYNRLLSLYREGDGMVPRFLRAISRPHYFYTSMYNLATNHDDFDGATSKGRATSQEAKQNLAEFATLYHEYENLNKRIKEGNCRPEEERRKEDLSKELAAREQHIRRIEASSSSIQVVNDYRITLEPEQSLRASASATDEGCRHSSYKIGDSQ